MENQRDAEHQSEPFQQKSTEEEVKLREEAAIQKGMDNLLRRWGAWERLKRKVQRIFSRSASVV